MSKKNPSKDLIKPAQISGLMQDEARMNAPNVHSAYGSSTTTFGPDGQPTITSQFSDPLQGIFDQQIAYLGSGPQQVTPYSNSGLDSLFSGFIDRMNQRNGGNAQATLSAPPPTPDFMTKPAVVEQGPTLTKPQQGPYLGQPVSNGFNRPQSGGGMAGGAQTQNLYDQNVMQQLNQLFGGR